MSAALRGTVVVGVDGSDDALRALWYGGALAHREGLAVRLVHVAQETAMFAPMMPYLPADSITAIGETVLSEAAKQAEEAGIDAARTTTVLAPGPRNRGLLENLQDARCIVLGTRSSAVSHLLTGSTSLSLAAHAPVPVHCVPVDWVADRPVLGHLTVGVAGSANDADVLAEAFAEAAARGSAVDVVHAWRPTSPYDAAIAGRTLREEWEAESRARITELVEETAGRHPDVVWSVQLRFDRVASALHAAAGDADLLILGRHGHHGPFGLGVGSNTRTLLRTATCPVVVVPVQPPEGP